MPEGWYVDVIRWFAGLIACAADPQDQAKLATLVEMEESRSDPNLMSVVIPNRVILMGR